jgi:hypothetical protein
MDLEIVSNLNEIIASSCGGSPQVQAFNHSHNSY